MQKLNGKKIQIVHGKGQSVPTVSPIKKGRTFFGLFASGAEPGRGTAAAALKELPLKKTQTHVPSVDMNAVRNWVGLEEKIIHDYKEQKKDLPKRSLSPSSPSVKPFLPAFETFSTQTTFSLAPGVHGAEKPVRIREKTSQGIGRSWWVVAWLVAGAFVTVYVQGVLSTRDTSRQLAQLQSEKQQIERSYAELQNASANQTAEMRWMSSQLRDMAAELEAAQDQKRSFSQDLEKSYRGELMRLTVQYEAQMDTLRRDLRAREAMVHVLKAQIQVFEKALGQAPMSAVSGAASKFFPVLLPHDRVGAAQGKVASVHPLQGFIVIDLGTEQGAQEGREVAISREGTGLAVGKIERVYPIMSSVVFENEAMIPGIQEGDTVSLF